MRELPYLTSNRPMIDRETDVTTHAFGLTALGLFLTSQLVNLERMK